MSDRQTPCPQSIAEASTHLTPTVSASHHSDYAHSAPLTRLRSRRRTSLNFPTSNLSHLTVNDSSDIITDGDLSHNPLGYTTLHKHLGKHQLHISPTATHTNNMDPDPPTTTMNNPTPTDILKASLENSTEQRRFNEEIISISKKIIDINDSQQRQSTTQSLHNKYKLHLNSITKSDGLISSELLSFLDSITLAISEFSTPLEKAEAAKWFATHASSGDLHKEIVEFLSTNPTAQWHRIQNHCITAFIGPNAVESFRQELDEFKQFPVENIQTFNRRFRQLVKRAYPNFSPSDDYSVLKSYVKALNDPQLIKLLYSGKDAPKTFEEAVTAVEMISGNLKRLGSFGISIPQDQIEFGPVDAKKPLSDFDKFKVLFESQFNRYDKRLKEIEIAAAQQQTALPADPRNTKYNNNHPRRPRQSNGRPRQTKYQWTSDNVPICYVCKKPGHMQRECYSRQSAHQAVVKN